MAKLTVNTGSSANSRDGDSLRAAFTKINANFTELYAGLGGSNVNLGAFEFTGSVVTTTDSSSIVIDQATTVTSDLTVGGDILPQTANGGDLGSASNPWRSLHVSNNTIFFGGVPLSLEAGTNELRINNVPVSQTITYADIPNAPTVPTDVSDLTDTEGLLGSGGTELPSQSGQEGKFLRTDGEDLSWVAITGAAGPVQPYLELTSTPFITQPVTLGTPVTVTAEPWGVNARLSLIIAEGPTLDVETITVTTAGTGYVVGQRYRIEYWQIGGGNDESSIDFEVATVGEAGELLTITNVAFVGSAANTPGTYTDLGLLYQPSVFDEIDTGLTLTRGRQQGIFNIEAETEYDNDDYLSPLGTEWNSDGWGDLTGLSSRTYETWRAALNNKVGDNIIGAELVMHDTINDKYYKFEFTEWGGNDGGFAYTRTLVEDPNYFRKLNYATANDVDVIEDDSTLQIGITRGLNGGIYNPFTEEGWDSDVSPDGTLWNAAGWSDLTDIETRTYTTFYSAVGGGLGNNILRLDLIMSVPSIEKYYAVKFLSWTQGIDGNTQGGGFSYTRREIDLTKLDEGVRFADGTVQKSAYIETNVVSAAPGERRIETASGYKQVSVTERVTTDYTGTLERTTDVNFEIYVTRNAELDEVLLPIWNDDVNADFEISLDGGSTYRSAFLASIRETEYWFYYNNNDSPVPQVAGDTVDIRILTGGDSVVWWNKSELPGGASDFRGAVIDYHAYTGESTIIGTIHIVDDDGEEYITHTEVSSGSTDGMNDNLWIVTDEGRIRYARFDGEAKTLKIHWTAKVFYGDETYD